MCLLKTPSTLRQKGLRSGWPTLRVEAVFPGIAETFQAQAVKMARARLLTVTATKGYLPAHADGETLCTAGERLECELLADQIEMICQTEESNA